MSEETTTAEAPKKKRVYRVSGEVELMSAKAIVRHLLKIKSGRRNAVLRMVAEYLNAEGEPAVQVPAVSEASSDDELV